MTLLLIYLAIAIGVSFLCSILEAVLLSITPGFVASQQQKNDAFSRKLHGMKEDIDKPLSAILTLNTFAHTFGAAGVGAQAQEIWGEEMLTVVSVVVTILILVGSEIIPKTLGATYWKGLARPTVSILNLMVLLLYPFVLVSQGITRLLKPEGRASVLSRNDIRNVAKAGFKDGVLHRNEQVIIDQMLRSNEVTAEQIMTPLKSVIGLKQSQQVAGMSTEHPSAHVSRIPVFDDESGNMLDFYVLKADILGSKLRGKHDTTIGSLSRPLLCVDADTTLAQLYTQMVEASEHIARVAKGHETLGIVTMENLIESLLGVSINDEDDEQRRDHQDDSARSPSGPFMAVGQDNEDAVVRTPH